MNVKAERISELTVNRLSVYLRCLDELTSQGIVTVSSRSLAERFNLNSAQIRKDLAYFGEFGVRGLGYNIEDLRTHLTQILGLNTAHRVGVIGAGNLGTALANYEGFAKGSFAVVALFDSEPSKIGRQISGRIPIHDIANFPKVATELAIDIAAIAVPARAAEFALNTVVAAGVKAVLNFAPIRLSPPAGVKIKHVDLVVSLESLSYYLGRSAVDAKAVYELDTTL